jgi:hypothetical protein
VVQHSQLYLELPKCPEKDACGYECAERKQMNVFTYKKTDKCDKYQLRNSTKEDRDIRINSLQFFHDRHAYLAEVAKPTMRSRETTADFNIHSFHRKSGFPAFCLQVARIAPGSFRCLLSSDLERLRAISVPWMLTTNIPCSIWEGLLQYDKCWRQDI